MTRGPVSVLVSEFVTNVIVQLETNSGDLLTYSECEPGCNDSPILQLSTGELITQRTYLLEAETK